jgi:hypothetical protein
VTNTPLADLDELVLLCRDERARLYIVEAVGCYRAGAYRSAIVAAWIAVCYDIIDKLRELALAGDKEAAQLAEEIERTRRANDISRALKIERELLDLARDKFELLSHLEHIDLQRLQEDRHRCAHPSLVSEDQGFNPSGELARLHIRSAVTHLLQHPPAQGKHALDRLLREVASEYFPDDVAKATASLSSGPLKRPRASLVRNFTLVLLKQAFQHGTDWRAQWRVFAALGAVRTLHPIVFEATLAERFSDLFRLVEDQHLTIGIQALQRLPNCWHHLAADVQHRLETFVRHLPPAALGGLDFLLEYPPLQAQASDRLAGATREELLSAPFFIAPPKVVDRYIDMYLKSRNYSEANDWARFICVNAADFPPDQQRHLLAGIASNSQVYESFEIGSVIARLRQSERLQRAEFESLLKVYGLEKFMVDDEDEA